MLFEVVASSPMLQSKFYDGFVTDALRYSKTVEHIRYYAILSSGILRGLHAHETPGVIISST